MLTALGKPDTRMNDLQTGHCGLACPKPVGPSQEVKEFHEGAPRDGPAKQVPLHLSLSSTHTRAVCPGRHREDHVSQLSPKYGFSS